MSNTPAFSFHVTATDGAARTGKMSTAHGLVHTPAFMPVGTQATVKGVHHDDVRASGAEILLGNTYHLMLRPTAERIAALGGLHTFMRWPHPILTDSGGFQVMSLAPLRKISEGGVTFRSHLDGAMVELTPERAVDVQILLGSDIAMQLDECVQTSSRADRDRARNESFFALGRALQAGLRTLRSGPRAVRHRTGWRRSRAARRERTRASVDLGFDGYAIGGLAVGEAQSVMLEVVAATAAALPAERPRYLMGVGTPDDLVEAIARGVDMFDCVMPTRNGRHGLAFTRFGPINIKNAHHADDARPLDAESHCPAAREFSRAYLHHLFRSNEMLGGTLLSTINLYYYQELMAGARAAIAAGRFADFLTATKEHWQAKRDINAKTT